MNAPNADAAASPPPAGDWRGFPPAALRLATLNGFLLGVLPGAGGSLLLALRLGGSQASAHPAIVLVGAVLVAGFAAWFNRRRWAYAGWRLDQTGLQVRRGRMWRREILIPRSRVQHLDLERGPIERRLGLATLTVHTAGTRLHALRQPGFLDADAIALRDALVPASDRHDDVL